MLTIGLTGGIGSGKSTVANFFSELGIEIIDADQMARTVVQPGAPAYENIVAHFGPEILDAKQHIERKKLRNRIFKDPDERKWLENLLHPLIRQAMRERAKTVKSPYCIMVIPLLVETKPNKIIDRVLVIDAAEEQQIAWAQQRDKLDLAQIKAVLKAQATRSQRLAAADDVIFNDADFNRLREQVADLHQRYLKLCKK